MNVTLIEKTEDLKKLRNIITEYYINKIVTEKRYYPTAGTIIDAKMQADTLLERFAKLIELDETLLLCKMAGKEVIGFVFSAVIDIEDELGKTNKVASIPYGYIGKKYRGLKLSSEAQMSTAKELLDETMTWLKGITKIECTVPEFAAYLNQLYPSSTTPSSDTPSPGL